LPGESLRETIRARVVQSTAHYDQHLVNRTGDTYSCRTLIGGLEEGLAGLGTRATHARQPLLEAGEVPMRTFGKTGVKLTVIGLASGRFPLISTEEAIALTRRAVELGINYFDTAHGYWNGHSEEVYGKVLPAVRQRVFLTTKATERTRRGPRTSSTAR
jgi:hypothetical protein